MLVNVSGLNLKANLSNRSKNTSLYVVAKCFFILLSLLLGSSLLAQEDIDQASLQALSESNQWRSLLYYKDRVLASDSSLVDSQEFFLSKTGKKDPLAELKATVQAFQKQDNKDLCRFPARYAFLSTKLSTVPTGRLKECEWITEYQNVVQPVSVSLVFSSYYLNNPSSMMGHTFMRLHRRGHSPHTESPALLDHALNFAAVPTTENPLLYPIFGLAGGFSGVFSLMPYYNKVSEYAHFERRDLWEYELNLSPEEVEFLFLAILEIGSQKIDYFYIDENCSYIMLYLLSVVKPDLHLTEEFHGIVVLPGDTIKAVERAGLVRKLNFRPGRSTQFQQQFQSLSNPGKDLVRYFKNNPNIQRAALDTKLMELPDDTERAKVLDTTISNIELEEKLIGTKRPGKYEILYDAALSARAKNPTITPKSIFTPSHPAPDKTRDGLRVGIGAAHQTNSEQTDSKAVISIIPALTDHLTANSGFPDGLGIELGHTEAWFDKNHFYIKKFRFVDITSNRYDHDLGLNPSWRLRTGYLNQNCTASKFDCIEREYSVIGGIGLGVDLFGGAKIQVGISAGSAVIPKKDSEAFKNVYAVGGTYLEVQANLTPQAKLTWNTQPQFYQNEETIFVLKNAATLSLSTGEQDELRANLEFGREWQKKEFSLIYNRSFY